MDRLGEITISGFRSIRVIDNLALKPINILIGANGAGKGRLRIPDEQGIKSSPETRAGRIESAPPHGDQPNIHTHRGGPGLGERSHIRRSGGTSQGNRPRPHQ